MKTLILAAVATLRLGARAAYAAGGPVGYEAPVYGSQTFSDRPSGRPASRHRK